MATTASSNLGELLEPFVTEIFFNRLNELEVIYTKLLNVVPSTRAFEDTFRVADFGTFVLKPEGAPISYDSPIQSNRKRVVHQTFALGFRVTMEMQADDQHGIISRMPSALADSARDHRERLAHNLFNDAFAGNIHTGIPEPGTPAGNPLCATHTLLKTGGTYSNSVAPAVALSVSGLEAAITNMRLTVNESGRFVVMTPKMVLTHPNEEFNAAQILESTQLPGSADNDINPVSTSRMGIRHMQSNYLTDTDNWFLLVETSQTTLKWYNRMDLEFGNNKDSQTKDALFDAMYRASVTFDDWRGVVGVAP